MNRSKIRTLKTIPEKTLSSTAFRALREAEERCASSDKHSASIVDIEINGRKGPDPVRYGDWEKNGIASDF